MINIHCVNDDYLDLLRIMSSLSGLFSDNDVLYLYYRNAENLFCYALNAKNLSRDDSAFDALMPIRGINTGIGLKTFICQNNTSTEKVAEFNQLSKEFRQFNGEELMFKIANARNERIAFAKGFYGVENAIYHIVSRRKDELRLFEENYDLININQLQFTKSSNASLNFTDGLHEYSYNYSKSTLFKKFYVPQNYRSISVEIIKEPYQLLLSLEQLVQQQQKKQDQYPFVVLPLYSPQQNAVPEKSGLNQWNAGGRKRSYDEVYISIPASIHQNYPNFFPSRDTPFTLITPDGKELSAKVCQDGGKALMTNPNSALADWLLRKSLKVKEGELLTMERLELMDFDSVIVSKIDERTFKIDKAPFGAFESFMKDEPITTEED